MKATMEETLQSIHGVLKLIEIILQGYTKDQACTCNDLDSLEHQSVENVFPTCEKNPRDEIRKIEITIEFPEPIDRLKIARIIHMFRKHCRELMDVKMRIRYLADPFEKF